MGGKGSEGICNIARRRVVQRRWMAKKVMRCEIVYVYEIGSR